MLSIMEKKDYDCKGGEYPRPNTRKNHILDLVNHGLEKKFGVSRSKDQLCKRWSDLKLRDRNQLQTIRRIIKKKDKRKKLCKLIAIIDGVPILLPLLLLGSLRFQNMSAQNVLYLCIEGQPDLETSKHISNAETNQGSDPNVLEDIEKCKMLLATIKQSVKSLETTLGNICKKVCNAGE
ncbi:hypothetical protein XENTR_v10005590 [Xenopus tropicalis]|nr:hypothetical protein XENTR_v10005590 [Xenopus tropicalis]